MPLRAIHGDAEILAFDYDEIGWTSLKADYKGLAVHMPCCGRTAVPKTSKLGNFFFAHAVRAECPSAPEGQEHIFLKSLIGKAAKRVGWTVKTEWPGSTPNGEQWIADVFCQKGSAKVAIEVQLSYQTVEELKRRSRIYRESGVRVAWIVSGEKFKNEYIAPSREIPLFRLTRFTSGEEPSIIEFGVPLSQFIVGALNKQLKWEEVPWDYSILFLRDDCWHCGRQVKQVYGYAIDVYGEVAKTVPNASSVLERISGFIRNDELVSLGLNPIARFDEFKGKTMRFPFCSACAHCGAPQNNYHLLSKLERNQSVDSALLGTATFTSSRQSTGSWRFDV
ncbi:competence protein CoiA [Caballeronia sp. GaOx3]|uniref:competence protein CoiA n=1 Tax=Caballeronia sp. GaOx3 TaxID=2921740 RepID=UPI002028C76A|nr:competence protein CoiA family protein [Caballeronia sp. GaOx3]